MNWLDVLENLWEELDQFRFEYNPQKTFAQENEVLLGFGEFQGKGHAFHHRYSSEQTLSEHIRNLPEEHFPIPQSLKELDIYIEDLTLDSVFGFILLYLRNHGCELEDFFDDYLEYVVRWEQGDVKTTGHPFSSWGCLHSALAQAYIDQNEETSLASNYVSGFRACVQFAIALLLEKATPHEVPDLDHYEEYNRARTFLQIEYEKYLQSLKSATITQLELPLIHAKQRILVDAFLSTENTNLGLLKSFLYNDEERSYLKSGFGFIAIHCPHMKGTSNYFMISVDRNLHIHLKELWHKLVAIEKERCDDPSIPIEQFYDDDAGNYQVITAPKHILTRLEWSDVIRAIWELYNPAKSLIVRPFLPDGTIGKPCLIYECPPILRDELHQKQFIAVKWDSLSPQQTLVTSPSMKRYLAVCASGIYQNKVPPIHPLPPELSFDFMQIPCGFAIIHPNGILILDDWNNEELNLAAYQTEVEHLLERVRVFSQIYQEVSTKVNQIKQQLEKQNTLSRKDLKALIHWISKVKLKLRQTLLNTMPSSIDYNLNLFRETVEKRWGLKSQLNDLYETVTEFEHIVKSYTEAKTNQLINMISIFGFPLALFSGLFEFIFQEIPSPKWLGIHWVGLFTFLSLSGLSIVAIRQFLKKS